VPQKPRNASRNVRGPRLDGFEEFRPRGSPQRAEELRVTIGRRDTIGFNTAAYEALGSPAHVDLLFNRAERVIAIRASMGTHGYRIALAGAGSYVVACTAFLGHYEISSPESVRRGATCRDNVVYVDLNDPGTVVTRRRAGSRGPGRLNERPFSPE
jgi:hypothetical protein